MALAHGVLRGCILGILALCACPVSAADTLLDAPIHWAYAAEFGTGAYSVGDREVYMITLPIGFGLPSPNENTKIHLALPLTFGVHDFDVGAPIESFDVDNVAQFTFVPSVRADIDLSTRWRLSPYGGVGFGTEIDGSSAAFIYRLGLVARRQWDWERVDLGVSFGGGLFGFESNEGTSDGVTQLMVGLDLGIRTGLHVRGEALWVKPHFAYRHYLTNLVFIGFDKPIREVGDEFEIGLSMGPHRPVKIFFFNFDRLGIAYRENSFGGLRGIRIVGSFPF